MRLTLLFLVVFATSTCASQCPRAKTVTQQVAVASIDTLCRKLDMVCYPDEDDNIRLAWTNGSTVTYSRTLCAKNLPLCRFAIWHEYGHTLLELGEFESDCYAAKKARKREVDMAICSLSERRASLVRSCR